MKSTDIPGQIAERLESAAAPASNTQPPTSV